MKLFSFRFSSRLLASLLAVSAIGSISAAEKTKSAESKSASDKFELSWTRLPAPELKFALEHLKSTEQSFNNGQAAKEELLQIRQQIEMLERRAGYSLTIRSSGGSLREFVAATSGSDEVSFTLINAAEPSDLDTPIPAFTLRNSNWGTVANVLGNFLATRGLILTIAGSDNPNPSESKSVVCVLRRDRGWADPAAASRQSEFESFSLADCLSDKLTIDNVTDAIQAAVKLASDDSAASLRIKFHPATKMLFVSGPEPVIKIARQVVASLPKNPVAR